MIPRSVANRFANVMGVDLHLAQQEIVLLYALDALAARGVLDRLVFKGGTYLRMMVTGDVGRLSEDLDFTNQGLPDDPEPQLREAFAPAHQGVQFAIREPYRTTRRNWGCRVAYSHEWDAGIFRLEISYRESPFLPPARWVPKDQPYFQALPFTPPEIPSLRVEEALAEKLRAIQQRATERDLYDAMRYGHKGFDTDLVRLLAVAKLWNEREAFDPDRILRTLSEGRREWPDLERLIGRSRRRNWNRDAALAAERFRFLRELTPFEQSLVADARRHALRADLDERLSRYALPERATSAGRRI
ncbi:MAG TPA: nucleotidyl transferase AbiEii/AbiGii toxin family protein [Thermoplasmata archaeon]|nr:nucleotidyl transferase AbiEii/AbiGii toxin family protein [Thermoplasmata archaeon]